MRLVVKLRGMVGDPGIEPGVRLREGAGGGPCRVVGRRIDPVDRSVDTGLPSWLCESELIGREWWATLESNQACVSARELQSPATPCGLSPTAHRNMRHERGDIFEAFHGQVPISAISSCETIAANSPHCA